MDKSWKMFRSESGICSLENRALEERSFYRMKVFLRNFYRDQYREEEKVREQEHKSLLYSIAMNLRGKSAELEQERVTKKQKKQENEVSICNLEFYVGRKKFLLTWDEVLGLVITAIDERGNDVITNLEGELAKTGNWF